MGQELTSMCSCFDSNQEAKEEMSFIKPVNDIQAVAKETGNVEGFIYETIETQYKAIYNQYIQILNEGVSGYDVIIDKDNCKVYSREAEEGYVLKYTWTIPNSREDFMEFMDRVDLRKTWDSNIDEVTLHGQFSRTEFVIYTKYKKFLTFDPRETLCYSRNINLFGNLAVVTFSLESEKFPIQGKTVRVKLFVAGMYVENIAPDEAGNTVKITCFSHMDVGLPKNLNNIARKFAGTTIPPLTKKITTQLKKYLDSKNG